MKNTKEHTGFVSKAFEQSMTKVYEAEQRIAALHYAMEELSKDWGRRRERPQADEQFSLLHASLYQQLNDAYRNVFMWGVVSGDTQLLLRARKAAFNHYLKSNSEIMSHLGFSWEESIPIKLEEDFRKELDNLKGG